MLYYVLKSANEFEAKEYAIFIGILFNIKPRKDVFSL